MLLPSFLNNLNWLGFCGSLWLQQVEKFQQGWQVIKVSGLLKSSDQLKW
jgi:hypothetical protein